MRFNSPNLTASPPWQEPSPELSPFQRDRIERFAAAMGPIRSHRMDRVRFMAWEALLDAMRSDARVPVAPPDERDRTRRLFGALTSYRHWTRKADWLLVVLAMSSVMGGLAYMLVAPIAGFLLVLITPGALTLLWLLIQEACLLALRRRFGISREILIFALKEIVGDPRWEASRAKIRRDEELGRP